MYRMIRLKPSRISPICHSRGGGNPVIRLSGEIQISLALEGFVPKRDEGWVRVKADRVATMLEYFAYRITPRGFVLVRRGPFVSAKWPQTIDAPSATYMMSWTRTRGGRTNSRGSNRVRRFIRASTQRAG